ncbi:MAG: SurA N-terminal domain-containing protein [Hyphomicrobiales bacterium]
MLTLLRSAAGTWIAKILLGLLIASFAVWGITGASFNFATGTLASVGSVTISSADFQRQFVSEISRVSQQFGRRLTSQQARQFGIDQQVLGQLINQAALDDRANEFSVSISDDRLAEEILTDPLFADGEGNFNAGRYQQVLYSNQYTESQFLDVQRRTYARRQIIDALTQDMPVPNVLKEAVALHSNEERTIEFIELDARDIQAIGDPDDTTLSTYFTENKLRYRAPEYRSLKYLVVLSSDFGGEDKITDEAAREYYDANRRRYETPETRTIRRITFDTIAKAQEASDKIKAGKSFDDIAAELNLTKADLELGTTTKTALIDQKLADAAFALDVNTPSEAIATDFGQAIIFVDAIEGGATQGFEQTLSAIKKELAADQNNRDLSAKLDQVEEARLAGETFEEIAEKLKVKLVTVTDVAKSGALAVGGEIDDKTPALNNLLDEAYQTDVSVENDVIEVGRDGYLWFEVTDVKEARDQTLDEVKSRVVADWVSAETEKAVAAEADRIAAKMKEGRAIQALAIEAAKTVQTVSGVKRGEPAEGLSGPAVALAFNGAQGHVTTAAGDQANQMFVMHIKEIKTPKAEATETGNEQVLQAIQNDVIETYLVRIRNREGTSINAEALALASDLERQHHGGGHGNNY